MVDSIYNDIYSVITFIDSFLSIIVVLAGVYIYFTKRNKIIPYFNLLKNYSLQDTVRDLNRKLDQLNFYSADDSDEDVLLEIKAIFSEIVGQVNGNTYLYQQLNEDIIEQFRNYISDIYSLSESDKRGLVSEFRENLRSINLKIYSQIGGGNNDE